MGKSKINKNTLKLCNRVNKSIKVLNKISKKVDLVNEFIKVRDMFKNMNNIIINTSRSKVKEDKYITMRLRRTYHIASELIVKVEHELNDIIDSIAFESITNNMSTDDIYMLVCLRGNVEICLTKLSEFKSVLGQDTIQYLFL